MLTNILLGLLGYSVFLTLFLLGWQRHCKRLEQYDRAMQDSLNTMQHEERIARIHAALK